MRSKLLLLLSCALLGACASENIAVTGIPRARAISIATAACKEYPNRYSVVDRAKWIRDGAYWEVEITDTYGEHGRSYRINRTGKIIGKGVIPEESSVYRGHRAYDEDRPYYYDDARPYYDDRPYRRHGWYY